MGVLVDLRNQVQLLLRRINGGTENPHGWSEGVVLRYGNNTGTTLDIGSIVRLRTAGDSNFVELMDVEEGDSLIGIVQGTYEQYGPNNGLFLASNPSNSQPVAVMTSGLTYVRVSEAVSRGEYAYASATAGRAKGLSVKRRGAFGRFQLSSGSNTALVRMPLTSIFTGSEVVSAYEVERVTDLVRLDFSSGFAVGSNAAADVAAIDLAYENFELDAAQVKVANASNYFTANSPATAIETLRPNSDFLVSGTLGYSTGSTAYTLVDEAVYDPADYYYFTSASAFVIHGYPASALDTSKRITSITIRPRTGNPAPAADAYVLIRNPQTGERYTVKTIGQNSSSTAGEVTLTTRPWDARPWTVDDMRHLQTGFLVGSTGYTQFYVEHLYIEVNYANPVTVESALTQLGAGGGGGGSHTILSATHTDTLAGTVVRGDIMRGNSTPKWERLPIGGSSPSNAFLSSNGTDAFWEWPAPVHRITSSASDSYWGQVDFRAGSGVAFARSSNTLTISSSAGAGGGGGAALTVTEEDGSPSVASVDTIKFPNGSVTDLGGGDVMVRDVPQAFIGAKVYNAATQSISDSTPTALTFDSEEYDSDTFHSTSSATSRFTIPAGLGGKYRLTAGTTFAVDADGARAIYFRKNGTTDLRGQTRLRAVSASTVVGIEADTDVDLVAGDYVEVMVLHDAGAATNVGHASTATEQSWAALFKLDSGRVGSGIGASVYHSANQSVTDGVVLFDSERFDTDGFHSTSSSTERMTIPAGLGGKYLITASIYDATGACGRRIHKNGSVQGLLMVTSSAGEGATVVGVLDLAAGDYVDIRLDTSGGAHTINGGDPTGSSTRATFSIMRLDSGTSAYTGSRWGSGTAFPSGPATNDRFTRTDLGLDFYYDGTRWLTTTLYHMHFGNNANTAVTSTSVLDVQSAFAGQYDAWVEDVLFDYYPETPNDGTHNWTLALVRSATGGGGDTSMVSFTSAAAVDDQWNHSIQAEDALVGTSCSRFYLSVTKNSSPGGIRAQATMTYRLVG